MNNDLKRAIETSSLIVHEEVYVYLKVRRVPVSGEHFLISRDQEEITVITKSENIGKLDVIDKSNKERALLEIRFSEDSPDAPGFLAAVSSALATEEISISVVSTFSKDYILVSKEDLEKALSVMKSLGFKR